VVFGHLSCHESIVPHNSKRPKAKEPNKIYSLV
jgi:hypothetical protein